MHCKNCYVAEDGLHLTLHKTTETEYRIKDSIDLQYSVLQINRAITEYYNDSDESDRIVIKTAVASPGFLEIILPYIPNSLVSGFIIFRGILGRTKSSDGEENTGIMAILTKANQLLNDHSARKKIDAEIKQIEANTAKTLAEMAQTEAQTRKINAEAEAIEIQNRKDLATTTDLVDYTHKLKVAAQQLGIDFEKQLDDVS